MLILNKRINLWLAGTGKRIIEEDIPKETDQKNIKKAILAGDSFWKIDLSKQGNQ